MALYRQVYKMVVSGTASSTVFTDVPSRSMDPGEVLADLSAANRARANQPESNPKLLRAVKQVYPKVSTRPLTLHEVQHSALDPVRLSDSGLRLGDVVRSQEHHWKRTQRNIAGAIVRFEPVPPAQISIVGSDHWAYLNSGEGPVSLAIIEKVPAVSDDL